MYKLLSTIVALIILISVSWSQSHANQSRVQGETRPFRLPFSEPSGPNTWLMGQTYGNTTGAYRQRKTTYVAGQGIHFGIDLSTPCKTQVVAIGDGVVVGADGFWGSAPHNLMIVHANGYASLYGHLFERPRVQPGQVVKAGQVVALSGDPDETCYSRPHLHLEIRDTTFTRAYNPINLIEADWDNLALISGAGRSFERDLDEPRKWQTIEDQPDIHFGFALVNEFKNAWPPNQGTDR